MKTRILLLILLALGICSSGCLERRLFIRWQAHSKPELTLFWSGDSADIMTGQLPRYGEPWILSQPVSTQKDVDGSFGQSGKWNGRDPDSKPLLIADPSPITPVLQFHKYYFGLCQLRSVQATLPGAAMLPFPDPESGLPTSPVDSLKKIGFPFTADTQERLELAHGKNILEYYRLIVSDMFTKVADSLKLFSEDRAKSWGDSLSQVWFKRLNMDSPATNDLDFWNFITDSILPTALSPDQVQHGIVVSSQLKKVFDTYRDLEDEEQYIELKIDGKLISSNADTSHADTLVWKWDGKKLRHGGPYHMKAISVVWDPIGTMIIIAILILFVIGRIWLASKNPPTDSNGESESLDLPPDAM